MTVEEILNIEDGEYWTRDGGVLYRRANGSWASTCGACVHTPEQMRLRIERDQHRDECAGLWGCVIHPVIHVYQEHGELGDEWVVYDPDNPTDRWGRETHQQAIEVAYRLAVGE